jgi:cell division protein FtsN
MKQAQRGGFVMGLIVGLLVGLALALAVALYVTKVPIPFVNKVPQRSGDRDAEEREKNRNWDPNSPLYGNRPAKAASAAPPSLAASGVLAPAEPVAADTPPTAPAAAVATPPPAPASAPTRSAANPAAAASAVARAVPSTRDPAAILGDRPPAEDGSVSTKPREDPFTYFVQAGAYGRPEDAEQQRARLAMLGIETRITEREQSGRTVYRVRLGPFDKREQADAAKERLEGVAIEAALVRVQK